LPFEDGFELPLAFAAACGGALFFAHADGGAHQGEGVRVAEVPGEIGPPACCQTKENVSARQTKRPGPSSTNALFDHRRTRSADPGRDEMI
jgi:hypothetical protein